MQGYRALNEMIDYIETHLEEKIEDSVLARILGVNVYTMRQIFSFVFGMTVRDYIRKRRLSNAGVDLLLKKPKIANLALEYQYQNATSFSRAFERFHGVKPSRVSSLGRLKNFPKLHLLENNEEIIPFEYQVLSLDSQILYGFGFETTEKTIGLEAPLFYQKINQAYSSEEGPSFGMITYKDETRVNCTGYFVLYKSQLREAQRIVVPASKWLCFRISSQDPKEIQAMSHKFYLEFLPACKYKLKALPELEYYHDGVTDFLVPIY